MSETDGTLPSTTEVLARMRETMRAHGVPMPEEANALHSMETVVAMLAEWGEISDEQWRAFAEEETFFRAVVALMRADPEMIGKLRAAGWLPGTA